MGSQLRWILENAPEMIEGATTGFHCKDWLYFKLTGQRATDPSEANFTFGIFAPGNIARMSSTFSTCASSATSCLKSSMALLPGML